MIKTRGGLIEPIANVIGTLSLGEGRFQFHTSPTDSTIPFIGCYIGVYSLEQIQATFSFVEQCLYAMQSRLSLVAKNNNTKQTTVEHQAKMGHHSHVKPEPRQDPAVAQARSFTQMVPYY